MDSNMSAEVKEMLKSAKEAIKNKDPKAALKICKSIIDKDKENYLAWVMTGAAAFEAGSKDQSIAAYQKAVQISPNQVHAWQGLAQFYEKHNPTSSELTTVYNELRKIFKSDATKHTDYSIKYASILQNQSKFGQAANVYYTLLKDKVTKFEADSTIDKPTCALVENLAKLLSNPSVNDQPAEVYQYTSNCLSLVEQESKQPVASNLEVGVIVKLNENAIKSMIKFQSNWRDIEAKCLNVLATYDKENLTCFNALYDIYSEITICANEYSDLAKKIAEPLQNLTSSSSSVLALKRDLVELLRLINAEGPNSTNQAKLAEIKTKISAVKEMATDSSDSTGMSKVCLVYAENYYYRCVNDHANVMRTADEGLAELEKSANLIISELKPAILLKLHLSKAMSHFVGHNFKKSIQSFAKAESIIESDKIGDPAFYAQKSVELKKIEIQRYLIECHLRSDNKAEAGKIFESFSKLCNGHEAFKKHAELGALLMTIYSDNTPKSNATQMAHSLSEAYPNEFDFNFQFAKLAFSLLIARLKIKELQHSPAVGLTISESLLGDQTLSVEQLKKHFFNSAINSIRILPYRWEPVYLLGNYYKYLQSDSKRALKCFQKAYELCQDLNLVGLELVDCLLHEKEDVIATTLLKKAIAEIENCKWASLRLGIIYLKMGESNEAIRLFYNVIRNDPDDYNMWECLADAYLNRGSLTAAMKSFAKAYELNPNSVYSCYQVAHIKQTLNLYDEAIIDYFSVLTKIPNHMPTLKGLGETYFQMAKLNVQTSNDSKYLNHMEMSISYLSKAIMQRRDLCCLWKILGDCCMIIRYASSKQVVKMPVEKCLVEKNFKQENQNNEQVMLNKAELIKLAQESYKICCKLKSKCAAYWNDLGLNYFTQFQIETEKIAKLKTDAVKFEDQAVDLLDKSIECVTNAVNLEPQTESFWSMLGVLYCRKSILHAKRRPEEESVYNNQRYLAQHCFLKSLQLNDHDAILWTNLGVFYLLNNNFSLAHECFKKSQAIDPEYSVAWIGQAHIAETVDIEQSIDLYRHSVELGQMHTEAEYGYARIVSIITNDLDFRSSLIYTDYIEFLNGHSMASDCLIKYCDRIDTNADAYFLGGILFERLNLPLTSLSFYQKALEILESDENKSLDENEAKICLLVRRGYARLLCELNRYEEALLQLKKVNVKDSIDDLFSLGRIFFKLAKYQQCSKIFESALNVADETEISMVYTAIGMAQSKLNIQDSITWFFKSFQSKLVCIQSLFALCSIGLVKNDMKLINAVFVELDKHIEDKRYRFGIVKLKSIYYCLKKEYTKAIRCMSKYLHEYPTESKCWIELCLCLKRANNFDLALTICNIVVFKLNSHDANAICIKNSRCGESSNGQMIYECLQYLLLQKLIKDGHTDKGNQLLKIFEKTLYRYPANMSSWQLFKQFRANYKNVDDESVQPAASG